MTLEEIDKAIVLFFSCIFDVQSYYKKVKCGKI